MVFGGEQYLLHETTFTYFKIVDPFAFLRISATLLIKLIADTSLALHGVIILINP